LKYGLDPVITMSQLASQLEVSVKILHDLPHNYARSDEFLAATPSM
jgi:hypothetical protein